MCDGSQRSASVDHNAVRDALLRVLEQEEAAVVAALAQTHAAAQWVGGVLAAAERLSGRKSLRTAPPSLPLEESLHAAAGAAATIGSGGVVSRTALPSPDVGTS